MVGDTGQAASSRVGEEEEGEETQTEKGQRRASYKVIGEVSKGAKEFDERRR